MGWPGTGDGAWEADEVEVRFRPIADTQRLLLIERLREILDEGLGGRRSRSQVVNERIGQHSGPAKLFVGRTLRPTFRADRQLCELLSRDHADVGKKVGHMCGLAIHQSAAEAEPDAHVPHQQIETSWMNDFDVPVLVR